MWPNRTAIYVGISLLHNVWITTKSSSNTFLWICASFPPLGIHMPSHCLEMLSVTPGHRCFPSHRCIGLYFPHYANIHQRKFSDGVQSEFCGGYHPNTSNMCLKEWCHSWANQALLRIFEHRFSSFFFFKKNPEYTMLLCIFSSYKYYREKY